MENSVQVSQDNQNQGLLNLIQVKQEADDAPHIIYDDREQWAFLFSDAINDDKSGVIEPKKESFGEIAETDAIQIKVEHDPEESYAELPETQFTGFQVEHESVPQDCHWCCFTSTDPLDLIDHDYEKHSRFFQGKRIHKSYKCPSCAYTSIEPAAIRSHHELLHRLMPEPVAADCNVNEVAAPQKKKKKRKKPSWDTPKRRRRPKKGQNTDQDKIREDRRLRRVAYTRKYRASLSPDTLAKRRLNDAARMRLKRALESEEVKAERRKKQALHARLKRANETPEQVEMRRTTQRNRARIRRLEESDEQKAIRKERERLRARERRASLSLDKKEFIKEVERNRKRYRRYEAKVVNGDQFIDAMEFLSTSLSNSENAYHLGHPSITLSDPLSYNAASNSLMPVHMFVGHMSEDSPLPRPKPAKTVSKKVGNRSKSRKTARPAVKKTKESDMYQPNNLQQNADIPENSVRDFTILSGIRDLPNSYAHNEDNVIRNHLTVNKELKEEAAEFHERLDWRIKNLDKGIENTSKDIIETNKMINERNNDANKTSTSLHQPDATNITRACGKEYIELEASIHQQDNNELFNNIKQNQFSKIDKINKLLHRMYARESK